MASRQGLNVWLLAVQQRRQLFPPHAKVMVRQLWNGPDYLALPFPGASRALLESRLQPAQRNRLKAGLQPGRLHL
jgi:hypothetical protein